MALQVPHGTNISHAELNGTNASVTWPFANNSGWNFKNEFCEAYSRTSQNAMKSIIVIVFVFGLLSNLLVIGLVLKKRSLRKNMNFFLTNMALSDLLTMVLVALPLLVYIMSGDILYMHYGGSYHSPLHPLPLLSCKLYTFLYPTTPLVSLTTLVLVSWERYRAVSSHVRLAPLSRCRLIVLITACWVIPAALNCAFIKHAKVLHFEELGFYLCVIFSLEMVVLIWKLQLAFFSLMLICVLSLSILIIRKLWMYKDTVELPEAQKQRRMNLFKSAVKMIVVSLILFSVCFIPSFLMFSPAVWRWISNYGSSCTLYTAIAVSWFLMLLNSSLSPLIYFTFMHDFRSALKDIRCRRRRHDEIGMEQR